MADGVRVEIKGLQQLTRSLRRAGVQIKDMKAANATTGNVVVQAARPITPHATGALAASIRPAQRQSGVIVRAGGGAVRYARYVEYGTRKMGARSYLVRAAHDTQDRWLGVYEQELQRLMDQAASSSTGTGS